MDDVFFYRVDDSTSYAVYTRYGVCKHYMDDSNDKVGNGSDYDAGTAQYCNANQNEWQGHLYHDSYNLPDLNAHSHPFAQMTWVPSTP